MTKVMIVFRGKEKVKEEELARRGSLVNVEFKLPTDLLEKFDSKWRNPSSSTCSEAIQFLVGTIVDEAHEVSQYSIVPVFEGFMM